MSTLAIFASLPRVTTCWAMLSTRICVRVVVSGLMPSLTPFPKGMTSVIRRHLPGFS